MMQATIQNLPVRNGIRVSWSSLVFLILAVVFLPRFQDAKAQTTSDSQLVIVKMIARSAAVWAFEPQEVTVQQGDTLRFVQADVAPHNVEFKKTPKGTNLGEARFGPFLIQKGEIYDLVIDERFAAGEHYYVCTPHEALGMTGTLTVLDLRTAEATH